MKRARLRVILGLCMLQSGCSFVGYGARNLVEAPIDARDEYLLHCRFEHMAEEAWDQEIRKDPSLCRAYHYGRGFREGYADYLNRNGTGEPPAAAPWIYRTAAFETPEGQRDTEDWFAGFRYGAALARASGYRDAAIVRPLALPPAYGSHGQAPRTQSPASVAPPADLQQLPMPHKATAPPDDAKDSDKPKP